MALANSKGLLVPQLKHIHLQCGTGWKAATVPSPWVEQGASPPSICQINVVLDLGLSSHIEVPV